MQVHAKQQDQSNVLSDELAAAKLLEEEEHTAARAAAKKAKKKKQKAKRLLAKQQQQQEAQDVSDADSSVSALLSSTNHPTLLSRPAFGNSLAPTKVANVSSLLTPEQSSEARPKVATKLPQHTERSSSDDACKQLHSADLSLSSDNSRLQRLLCCPITQVCHSLQLNQDRSLAKQAEQTMLAAAVAASCVMQVNDILCGGLSIKDRAQEGPKKCNSYNVLCCASCCVNEIRTHRSPSFRFKLC